MILSDKENCVVNTRNDLDTAIDLFRILNTTSYQKAAHSRAQYDAKENVPYIITLLMPLKILVDRLLEQEGNYKHYGDTYMEHARDAFVSICELAQMPESLYADLKADFWLRKREGIK